MLSLYVVYITFIHIFVAELGQSSLEKCIIDVNIHFDCVVSVQYFTRKFLNACF